MFSVFFHTCSCSLSFPTYTFLKSLFFLKVSNMDAEPANAIPEPVEAMYETSKDAIDGLHIPKLMATT